MSKVIVDSCVLINSFQRDSVHRNDSIAFIDHVVRELVKAEELPSRGFDELIRTVLEAAGARLSDYRPVLALARKRYDHARDIVRMKSGGHPRAALERYVKSSHG